MIYTLGQTETFTLDAGTPPLAVPDEPGEMRLTKLRSTVVGLMMPPLPARADDVRPLYKNAQGEWTDCVITNRSGPRIEIAPLTPGTNYVLAACAFNAAGGTVSSRELWLTTPLTDPTGGGGGEGEIELPAKPVTPTWDNKRSGQVTVAFESWPERADTVQLRQNGQLIHTWTNPSGPRTFDALGLEDLQTYRFIIRGVNEGGDGPDSDPSAPVEMVSDLINLTWLRPVADTTAAAPTYGEIALQIGVNAPPDLWPQNPVTISLLGAELPGVRSFAPLPQWGTTHDTRSLYFQGSMLYTAQARDRLGLYTRPIERRLYLNNTLQNGTRYHHFRYTHRAGGALTKMLMTALLNQGELKQWIDIYATSPRPDGALDYADFAAMEAALLKWQPIKLDRTLPLLGTKTATEFAHTSDEIDIMLRATPRQQIARFATGATTVRKFRRLRDGGASEVNGVLVLTGGTTTLQKMSHAGLETVFDFSTRGMGDAIDGLQFAEDKFLAVAPDSIRVCDITNADDDFFIMLAEEARQAVAVEQIDGTLFLFYDGADGSSLHRTNLSNSRRQWEISEHIVRTWADKDSIFFSARVDDGPSHTLFEWHDGEAAPTALLTHSTAISDVFILDAAAIELSDATHVYRIEQSAARVLAELPAAARPGTAITHYKGIYPTLHGVAGATGNIIYEAAQEGETTQIGLYEPRFTLEADALSIPALERLVQPFVAAQGNPLQGGTPGVESEELIVGVEAAPGQGYIARIQKPRNTTATSYLCYGLSHLIVTPEGTIA